MDIKIYNRAKMLQERIKHIDKEMCKVKLMKVRENDEEFNILRSLAYDSLNIRKSQIEEKFKEL